ncbi:MAG: DUF2752 domain-containing protein [Elusimicrobia bacterium]|nr:DUF2752 domain-containing protein [Elusimicrobiota bacterium]
MVEKFFHIPCPVCGISSAIWMLVQGNLWKSLALHPAGIIIFVTLMLYMVYFAGAYMFGFGFSWQNEVRLKTYMDTCVFGFVGVVWLFRLVR